MAVQKTFTFRDGRLLNIHPSQIPIQTDSLWNAFGSNEAENSASDLLRFCQEKGSWEFTSRELSEYLGHNRGCWFLWWEYIRPINKINKVKMDVTYSDDETLIVSAEFIMRCWLAILK